MKRLIPLLFALCVAWLSPAHAQTRAQQYTLANGMTLIVQPDRRAPTAVHMVWLRVGSMDEVDGTSGVAHVLETGANEIHVDPALIPRARVPIDRMLAFTAALKAGQPVSGLVPNIGAA